MLAHHHHQNPHPQSDAAPAAAQRQRPNPYAAHPSNTADRPTASPNTDTDRPTDGPEKPVIATVIVTKTGHNIRDTMRPSKSCGDVNLRPDRVQGNGGRRARTARGVLITQRLPAPLPVSVSVSFIRVHRRPRRTAGLVFPWLCTVAGLAGRGATDLESVLGQSPCEFESCILRYSDQARQRSAS